MTTIAYRDGVMAADTLITCNGTFAGYAEKIKDINGYLIGISGNWGVACEIFDWFKNECKDGIKRPPSSIHVDEDKYPVSILAVRKSDGAVFAIDGLGYPQRITGKYFAIGSGLEIAMGAMEMGADAATAVKVAIKLDGHSGGSVRKMEIGKK